MNEYLEKYGTNKNYKLLSVIIGIITTFALMSELSFENNVGDGGYITISNFSSTMDSIRHQGSVLKMYMIVLLILTTIALVIAINKIMKKQNTISYIIGVIIFGISEYSILTGGFKVVDAYTNGSNLSSDALESGATFLASMWFVVIIYAIYELITLLIRKKSKKNS
ncbi:hypothetical protein RD055328_01450 [Companilactobacillus sp. RD055328]|uniref:hypothetical protein n=1 Tax=Companilactobacillus sp. RD055328 TaxID=2916634 RepID=UPI001FC82F79|nr:hypothetical protein [Companilactobacillus sp. RD055328]GKQ42222.1 hypothetical protein RD055328_01450 [Companilactobacillus sp. RD055328]